MPEKWCPAKEAMEQWVWLFFSQVVPYEGTTKYG
jgi:hypothetical protein